MGQSIDQMEQEIRDSGRQTEREYVFEGLDTRDGAGWVVRVDGEVIVAAASIGSLEGALRAWIDSRPVHE